MSNELTDVRCPCGAEFQADSYDAGFIAGSGMCQNCDAALPPKDICTCPSGDGSLVHPCPAHPAPVEQAGGDERDFQAKGAQEVPSPVSKEYDRHLIGLLRKGEALPGHQEEAADEIERLRDWNDHLNNTVLPNILNPNFLMLMKGGERLLDLCTKDGKFIGVSLNDMKDVFDWMVTHARIAPDHAALAQPSPVLPPFAEKVLAKLRRFYDCAEDFESGGVDIGRHWLDLLTQLGLLNRVQRSPALWEISQQGEDLLGTPQPSPASDLDPFNLAPHAEAFNEAPAEALKPEQAEAERPEVEEVSEFEREDIARSAFETAMADGISLDSFLSLSNTLAARYERIVGALRAELQAAEDRADTLEHRMMGMMTRHFAEAWRNRDTQKALDGYLSAGIAQLEQQRDAALSEVERLRQFERICEGLPQDAIDGGWTVQGIRAHSKQLEEQLKVALARVAELEKQEPVAYVLFRDGEVYYETDDNIVISNTPGDETDLYRWLPVFTAPVAQAQQLHDLDKQCRDDVARALGLRPSQERGFAWSYLLASIKSCVEASEDAAQAQHSVPEGYALIPTRETEAMHDAVMALLYKGVARTDTQKLLNAYIAAAPGKEGV
ncbi:hypothetical protein AAER22_20840 [Pseudomonas aeruginosa]|uniref:hypothetical protein n=3 Tax=Pseudomonas aeruginosa TaxID=287 RepID=UPI0037707472